MAEVWPDADPDLPERIRRWNAAHPERLEALVLEERALLERRGASGDPHADDRDAELGAHTRLFSEMLASVWQPLIDSGESAPEFSRRVAAWSRAQEAHRRAIEEEARAAWGGGPPPGTEQAMSAATSAPEPDEMRVAEAAAVWAHVRVLAEALEHALGAGPEAPA
jgi:ferric-dicitrate binding protein FerR (iron transport regulator)